MLPAKLPKVDKRELELASQLIESFAGDWKPEKYKDTYTDALKAVVKQKEKGGDLHRVREPEDLLGGALPVVLGHVAVRQ